MANKVLWERVVLGDVTLQIVHGDLTQEETDAIVNAANSQLLHAGGVAGAIAEKGGGWIQAESHRLAPVPVGDAVVTGAGKLPAKVVIHAVGPRTRRYRSGTMAASSTLSTMLTRPPPETTRASDVRGPP